MKELAYIALPGLLILLAYRTKKDLSEYADFKKIKSTKSRQSSYRKWILQSFLILGVTSVLVLIAIGHVENLTKPLTEFSQILPSSSTDINFGGDQLPFLLGMATSVIASGIIIRATLLKGSKKKESVVIGDIEALIPVNNAERLWGLGLALNAGLSEELFFRLTLPILFFIVFNNALLALVLSCISFALVHFYQGVMGIIFTGLLGVVLTYIYLLTGHIWIAMIIHAVIDINGLIIQPYILRLRRPNN